MSFSPVFREDSPEPKMSGLCVKLETQFTDDLSKAEPMKVFARVRPMLNSEVESGHKECIVAVDEQTVRAVVPSSSSRFKSNSNLGQGIIEDFRFTSAYGPDVGQFVFFEETMMSTMQNFIEGQNSLVFSYGITGSGKTFTLQGNPNNPGIIPLSLHLFFASVENQLLDKIVVKPDKFDEVKILNNNEAKRERQLLQQLITTQNQEEWNFRNSSSKSLGMVLCEAFSDKFVSDGLETTLGVEEMAQAQAAALMKELGKKSAEQQSGYCSIWVSFAEVYNEYVYDLLQPNVNQRTKLLLGEDKNGDVYVKGLTEVCVFSSFEALNILNFGQKNLKIASTKLNYQSSRSHCIFTIKVVRVPDPENISYAKVSRLSFCDLAGSERAAKSQTTGMRLKEAGCINTSLLVLGRCLEQLRTNPSSRERKRIPFRESKLTRLFSGFFTGKGKAVMITNASPSEVTFDETLHALRFSAVATELIINDSYIATASSTLQTITDMWTNARANLSASLDKSISFEDSTFEALQEKDELIEKLLDLAESLTKNLEIAKKEKAELEIKVRREVSEEFSEYSDELLERQKKIYEEEKESIREIYQKRIAAMEKMYENIIEEDSDGSGSSGDEEYEDAKSESGDITRNERKSPVNEKSFKDKSDVREIGSKANLKLERYIQDIEALKADLLSVTAELKSTKEELEKSKEYCLALETATEEMERKMEITNNNLEKSLSETVELKIKVQAFHQDSVKEETDGPMASEDESLNNKHNDLKAPLEDALNSNEVLKAEIDALKIDCVSYKSDNEDLFKKKNVLEEQLKALAKEFESIKSEKEDLYQKLVESETKVANLKDEIEMSEKKIIELVKSQEESTKEYEISLKNAEDELVNAKEAYKSVNQAYEVALLNIENERQKVITLETECASIREEMAEILKKNEVLEEKYASTSDDIKSEKLVSAEKLEIISNKLSEALSALDKEREELQTLKNTVDSQEEDLARLQKENQDLLKNRDSEIESDKLANKEELDTALCKLSEASANLEEQKRKAEELKNTLVSYEINIVELQKENKELKDKIKSKIELEELACKKELETVVSELAKASSALEEGKKKVENMTNVIISYEKETSDLQRQCEELKQSMNSKNESEVSFAFSEYEEEFDSVSKKLSHALSELCEEKKKVDAMNNAVASYKKEIAELQKQIFELQDVAKIKNESETLESQKELENVNKKLSEALSTLDVQKKELENMTNAINAYKLEIAELQKQNFELQQKINSEIDCKSNAVEQELDPVNDKLNEILTTVDELSKLQIENESAKNKVTELLKIEEDLKKEINSKNLHADTLYELLLVLEKCELHATKKEDMLMLDFGKLNETIQKLEAQLKENKDQYETECNGLKEMIKLLQKCELFASNKTKELHKSSITHVEQIMDLEKCVRQKDASIESLKNDNNMLQKQLKNLQDTSKKQLQAQKQQFTVEISNVKSSLEKGIKDLKEQVTKLTTEKGKLQSEIKNIKAKFDEVTENKNMLEAAKENMDKEIEDLKNQLNDQAKSKLVQNENKSSKNDEEEIVSVGIAEKRQRTQNRKVQNEDKSCKKDYEETISEGVTEKRLRTQNKKNRAEAPVEAKLPEKRSLRRKGNTTEEEKSEAKPVKKNEKRKVQVEKKSPEIKLAKNAEREESQVEKKSHELKPVKKTERGKSKVENEPPKIKPVTDDKKKETAIMEKPERKVSQKAKDQDEKKKTKKAGDKRAKTFIYEETDENINIENTPKIKNIGGRQLKSVENVTPHLILAKNKNLNLAGTKGGLKRKGLNDSFENILKEKKTLKKVKFADIENNLNLEKPQNLRIQLLKATNITNDIPMPSPRMTRGRKRLCNLDTKENAWLTKRSLKTVRS